MKKQSLIKKVVFTGAILAGMVGTSSAWAASTLNVDQNDPACSDVAGTPYCTIQAAVTAAVEGDTINIASGTYHENVLSADKGLILQGEDEATTIIDGGNAGTVVKFQSATDRDVELHDLTLQNGKSLNGGGIYHDSGSLVIENCSIISNEVTAGGLGGGVFFTNGELSISDSLIEDNLAPGATAGGVFVATATVNVKSSSISHNQANVIPGLYHASGILLIEDSQLDENTSTTAGGGLYHAAGNLTLKNSSVSKNIAVGYPGILNGMGSVTILDSNIDDNTSSNALGALYHTDGELVIRRSSISRNEAVGYTGIYHGLGHMILDQTQVDDNVSVGAPVAGIIQGTGNVEIMNSSISGNTATDYVALYFPATGGSVSITNSHIDNNEATGSYGGLINASVEMDATTVLNNKAAGNIAGLYLTGTSVEISNSTIAGNEAGSSVGGLYVTATNATLTNSTVSGNKAKSSVGGLFIAGNSEISSSTIVDNIADSDNDASGDVGGLYNAGGTMLIRNSIVAKNQDLGGEVPDCFGAITSDGYNLIGDNTACTFTSSTGDLIGTAGSLIDPLLESLTDNGGAVPTIALQATSPAVDAANPSGCEDAVASVLTVDARGFARAIDGNADGVAACDMGAFELGHCGDASLETGVEECDDGNVVDGDGCSSACTIETPVPSTSSGSSAGGCSINPAQTQASAMAVVFALALGGITVLRLRKKIQSLE
ncbi:hypothetical protein K1X76_06500 [bacterium]|nr:hypothetical protein [bacterium]